jgi:hypothetical protein
MSEWTSADRRIGLWSALSVLFIAVAYILTGVVWLISGGLRSPEPLQPSQPYRTILEFLMLPVALALVVLMAAVHAYAPHDRKTCTRTALAFTIIFAALTSNVHFVQLTAVRQMGSKGVTELSAIHLYPWPSVVLAQDFLAWDVFLGLALLFAASAFRGGKLQAAVRVSMVLSGTLCVAGVLGPASGDLRFQFMGILGYAGVLPVVCGLLARLFARPDP